jgi:hypothetical protein
MALTVNHPLLKEQTFTVTAGAATIVCAVRAQYRGKIVKIGATLGAAITSAPLVVVGSIIAAAADAAAPGAGTAITHPTLSVSNTNSAAGSGNSVVPTAANIVNEDDVIVFTPSGAAGATTAVTYAVTIQVA